MKKRIVVLTGAGISAESGIKTFRDSDGLWENHRIEDVATPEAWERDAGLVLKFYNERRKNLLEVLPNAGHFALTEAQEAYDVQIITQNVDDLHERAGHKNVLHLHGELRKVRSTRFPQLVYDWDVDLHIGDLCEKGAQLRPHIVWFGESVPMIEPAIAIAETADVFMVIGTSLQVYPAASLMMYAPSNIPVYYIDPRPHLSYELQNMPELTVIAEPASTGVQKALQMIRTSARK